MDIFWIILTGILIGSTGGILGSFLMLRKMAMLGDAISHAVLPGIVIAFLLSGSKATFPMLAGAAIFGVLTAALIQVLHDKAGIQSDAAIGISFTTLFAVGVILLSVFAGNVDLDQDCVLYGEIAYVPLQLMPEGSFFEGIPRSVAFGSILFILVLLLVIFGYKGLVITSFNPEFAATMGISTVFWHYLLMSAVSLTTVISFESVGAILVVAFMIVPASTAYLLSESLPRMLLLSVLTAILSATGGYFLAYTIDGSIAGAMATVSGFLFLLAFLFSPSQGLVRRLLKQKRHAESNPT